MCRNKESSSTGGYDLGELDDQALFLYLDAQDPSSNHDQIRTYIYFFIF